MCSNPVQSGFPGKCDLAWGNYIVAGSYRRSLLPEFCLGCLRKFHGLHGEGTGCREAQFIGSYGRVPAVVLRIFGGAFGVCAQSALSALEGLLDQTVPRHVIEKDR